MARGSPGRSCLKYFNIIKKTTPTPTVKKLVKFQKFFFFVCDDFFQNKTHTLSYDRESLVTSLLVFFLNECTIRELGLAHLLFCFKILIKIKKQPPLPLKQF